MALLLLIETSGKNCSVSLVDDNTILSMKSASADHFIHAEQLHVMMHALFDELNHSIQSLDAVAISKGPGSYTGLRIGASAAKGLCFALNIPLIALDTTEILAHHASRIAKNATLIIPMIDARRMEVYAAHFNGQAQRMTHDEALIIDEQVFRDLQEEKVVLIGDGAEKCRSVIQENIEILSLLPNAEMMHALAVNAFKEKQFEDVAYFEPFYLKDYVPGTSKKSVL